MNCEIEFLAVGSGSKPGDAIIVRYGEENAYELMVVDGGNNEAGEAMVAHLKKYFGEGVALSHVVLTHSDADHASGLREVLREIPVENLWLHIPWMHLDDALPFFKNENLTSDAIKKEYDIVSEIVEIAESRGCTIYPAFQGSTIGPFTVLNPSKYAYVRLLPQFDRTPDPDEEKLRSENWWLGKMRQPSVFAGLFEKAVATAQKWIKESWYGERLKDGGVTSASNETSIVLFADFGDKRVLLTGDAGINALTWAAGYAEAAGLPLQQFSFVQIPHHGSRRNVGPTILDRILGAIQPETNPTHFTAIVSAPANDATHPRKIVLNAFTRRGANVLATQGQNTIYYGGFQKRSGYVDATPIPLAETVEDYD